MGPSTTDSLSAGTDVLLEQPLRQLAFRQGITEECPPQHWILKQLLQTVLSGGAGPYGEVVQVQHSHPALKRQTQRIAPKEHTSGCGQVCDLGICNPSQVQHGLVWNEEQE